MHLPLHIPPTFLFSVSHNSLTELSLAFHCCVRLSLPHVVSMLFSGNARDKKSDLMMRAVEQSFSSSLLLLGYDREELMAKVHFRIKGILFSEKNHSDFMHFILFVDFEYMIPNKIAQSPLW